MTDKLVVDSPETRCQKSEEKDYHVEQHPRHQEQGHYHQVVPRLLHRSYSVTFCLLIGWFVSCDHNVVFWLVGLCHVIIVLRSDWAVCVM